MENPILANLSNTTLQAINEMDQFIPKEFQMPVGIAVCYACYQLLQVSHAHCSYFSFSRHVLNFFIPVYPYNADRRASDRHHLRYYQV